MTSVLPALNLHTQSITDNQYDNSSNHHHQSMPSNDIIELCDIPDNVCYTLHTAEYLLTIIPIQLFKQYNLNESELYIYLCQYEQLQLDTGDIHCIMSELNGIKLYVETQLNQQLISPTGILCHNARLQHTDISYLLTQCRCIHNIKLHMEQLLQCNQSNTVYLYPSIGALITAIHSLHHRYIQYITLCYNYIHMICNNTKQCAGDHMTWIQFVNYIRTNYNHDTYKLIHIKLWLYNHSIVPTDPPITIHQPSSTVIELLQHLDTNQFMQQSIQQYILPQQLRSVVTYDCITECTINQLDELYTVVHRNMYLYHQCLTYVYKQQSIHDSRTAYTSYNTFKDRLIELMAQCTSNMSSLAPGLPLPYYSSLETHSNIFNVKFHAEHTLQLCWPTIQYIDVQQHMDAVIHAEHEFVLLYNELYNVLHNNQQFPYTVQILNVQQCEYILLVTKLGRHIFTYLQQMINNHQLMIWSAVTVDDLCDLLLHTHQTVLDQLKLCMVNQYTSIELKDIQLEQIYLCVLLTPSLTRTMNGTIDHNTLIHSLIYTIQQVSSNHTDSYTINELIDSIHTTHLAIYRDKLAVSNHLTSPHSTLFHQSHTSTHTDQLLLAQWYRQYDRIYEQCDRPGNLMKCIYRLELNHLCTYNSIGDIIHAIQNLPYVIPSRTRRAQHTINSVAANNYHSTDNPTVGHNLLPNDNCGSIVVPDKQYIVKPSSR